MHDDEKNITNDKAVDGLNQPSASTPDDQCLGGCLSVLVSRCGGSSPITTLRSLVTLVTLALVTLASVRAAPDPHLARKPDNSVHTSTAALTASTQYIYSTGNNTE